MTNATVALSTNVTLAILVDLVVHSKSITAEDGLSNVCTQLLGYLAYSNYLTFDSTVTEITVVTTAPIESHATQIDRVTSVSTRTPSLLA